MSFGLFLKKIVLGGGKLLQEKGYERLGAGEHLRGEMGVAGFVVARRGFSAL